MHFQQKSMIQIKKTLNFLFYKIILPLQKKIRISSH